MIEFSKIPDAIGLCIGAPSMGFCFRISLTLFQPDGILEWRRPASCDCIWRFRTTKQCYRSTLLSIGLLAGFHRRMRPSCIARRGAPAPISYMRTWRT